MTKAEERAIELVNKLMPKSDKIEFKAKISNTGRSIEFFVWVNGEKFQCYELADNGKINELEMEKLFDAYAEFIRKSEEYKAGEVNKIYFVT